MEVGSIWARLGVEYGEWRTGLREASNQMREFSRQVQAGLQEVGRAMAALGASITAGLGVTVKQFADFESQMRNVNSIVKDSEAGFKRLSDTLLAMPAKEGLSQGPRELAAALYDISSSGFEGEKGLGVLKAAAKAADAGMTTAAVSAKGLTGLLNAYSLTAEDAAHVSDVMFKTVEKGVVTFPELANSIGNVASTAATAGIKLEEMMAGIAALTLKGIKPDEAVTALNGAITKLSAATPEARKLMQQLGIEVNETTLKQKGLAWAIEQVYTKTGGSLGGITKIMGDERAAKAVMALGSDPGKMREFTKANVNAQGSTDSALAEQKKSLLKQMEMLRAQMEATFIKIGQTIAPYIGIAVGFLKQFQQAWEQISAPVQSGIVLFTAVAGAAATVAGGLILLAPSISAVIGLFSDEALTTALSGIAAGFSAAAPVILGLGAAAVALYVAWTDNWGGIQEKTRAFAETIKGYLQTAFTWVKEELPRIWSETWQGIRFALNRAWTEIQPGLDEFVAGVTDIWHSFEPMIPGIIAAFKILWEALKAIFATIYAQWEVMWTAVKGAFSIVWPLIVGNLKAGLEIIKTVFSAGLDLLQGNWQKAWDRMKEGFSRVWDSLAGGVKNALKNMLTAITESIGSFASVGQRLMEAFAQGVTRGKKAVDDAASDSTPKPAAPNQAPTGGGGPNVFVDSISTGAQRFGDWVAGSADGIRKWVESKAVLQRSMNALQTASSVSDRWALNASLKSNYDNTQRLLAETKATGGKKKGPQKTLLDELLAQQRIEYAGATVTGRFADWRSAGRYRRQAGQHNGYDIAMPAGTAARAAWPGRVSQIVQWAPGEWGVVVEGGGRTTTYGHLRPTVKQGQEISAGTAVGKVAVDHVDVKMRDQKGRFVDYAKVKATQGDQKRLAAEGFQSDVKQFLDGGRQKTPLERLKDLDETYATIRNKANPSQLAEVDRRYQEDRLKLLLEMQRDEENFQNRVTRLRTDASDNHVTEVEKEIGAVKDRYLSMYRELEDQAIKNPSRQTDIEATRQALVLAEQRELGVLEIQKRYLPQIKALEDLKREHPDQTYDVEQKKSALLIAAARERAAFFIQLDGVTSESARKAMAEVMTLQDGVLQRTFEHSAKLRESHQITLQEQLARDGEALNSFTGTEEAKNQYRLQYQELFKQQLQEQQAISIEDEQTSLQRYRDNLLQADQTLVTNQIQIGVVQDMLRAQRLAKLQAEKQAIVNLGQQMATSFEGFLVNVASGQTKFNDAFKSLWKSITDIVIKYVADMIINVLALQKIMNAAFGWLTGGIGSIFGGVFGGAGGVMSFTEIPGLPAIAHTGGLVIPGGIRSFHTGGIAGSTLRSDEVLAKLQVGEMVLSRAQVAAIGRGGGAAEQPAVFSPSITFSGDVHVHSEADMDRLASTLAQRMREEWQAW